MKPFAKRLILSCTLLSTACTAAVIPAQASSVEPVKIQVNDELIQFPDALPFIDADSNLQVPLRFLSERLGYVVDWSMKGQEVKVQLKNKSQDISLTTGERQAVVNGELVSLEGSATFKEGRAYVPLRFISETFGSPVHWDDQNQVAIVNADGKEHKSAWIAPPPPPAPLEASVTDQIVEKANALIGVPYLWGGTNPNGFDCSGFVRYLFQQKGIDLPRTAAQMHNLAGTKVADLQVGDLVFFAKGSVNHVGIYLGNNRFISATSSRGVTIEALNSGYWGARYVGAKRVL